MPHTSDDSLRRLHDEYVDRVNSAVSAGRDDLARELAATFEAEALETRRRTRTVSLPLADDVDTDRRASRFVREHASRCGLAEDVAERLVTVTRTLFRVAGDGLAPRTLAMSHTGDRVDLVAEFVGSGGVRLEDPSTADMAALTDRWGWEETASGLRVWARLHG